MQVTSSTWRPTAVTFKAIDPLATDARTPSPQHARARVQDTPDAPVKAKQPDQRSKSPDKPARPLVVARRRLPRKSSRPWRAPSSCLFHYDDVDKRAKKKKSSHIIDDNHDSDEDGDGVGDKRRRSLRSRNRDVSYVYNDTDSDSGNDDEHNDSRKAAKKARTTTSSGASGASNFFPSGERKVCASCDTTSTPYWRDGCPNNHAVLCNACGIRWKKRRVLCNQCTYVPRKEEGGAGSACTFCNHGVFISA